MMILRKKKKSRCQTVKGLGSKDCHPIQTNLRMVNSQSTDPWKDKNQDIEVEVDEAGFHCCWFDCCQRTTECQNDRLIITLNTDKTNFSLVTSI